MSSMPLKVPLTATNTARLLDMLCEDDAFRAEFQRSPTTALEEHGLQARSANAMCASPLCLASKEEFKSARQILQKRLVQTAVFQIPHFFETNSGHHQLHTADVHLAA